MYIGKDKTGIRLSPYGVESDMPHYPEIDATYDYLTKELNKLVDELDILITDNFYLRRAQEFHYVHYEYY